jgi:hypothetical protein
VKCDKSVTCRDAYGLRRALEDQNFIFWLTLFHKIFPHVETLFNQFQNRKKDGVQLLKDMETFEAVISSVRNNTDEIEKQV